VFISKLRQAAVVLHGTNCLAFLKRPVLLVVFLVVLLVVFLVVLLVVFLVVLLVVFLVVLLVVLVVLHSCFRALHTYTHQPASR